MHLYAEGQHAFDAKLTAMRSKENGMSTGLTPEIDSRLRAIEEAIRLMSRALRKDPGNYGVIMEGTIKMWGENVSGIRDSLPEEQKSELDLESEKLEMVRRLLLADI